MRTSSRTTAAERGTGSGRIIATRALLCFLVLMFAAMSAIAQLTSTVQFGGNPNALNAVSAFTIPRGGIILNGAAINPATGAPYRHLWVGDNTSGWCRIDPDIDTVGFGFHKIDVSNPAPPCTFKLNGLSVTGGPINLDPTPRPCVQPIGNPNQNCNFLYMTDARNSEGIFRILYDPNQGSGHGLLEFASVFAMAGNPTGARFQGGQTGCQFPLKAAADTAILGPDGNLWATTKRGGQIFRINNPATADKLGFGTCDDFLQTVALAPDGRRATSLAWIGHDLWSSDGGGAFVITNADTTCQAISPGMTPTCASVPALGGAVAAANGASSDQIYPQLNGNNLYYGVSAVLVAPTAPGLVAWVADAQGAQIITPDIINNADIAASLGAVFPPPNPFPLGIISEPVPDMTDPANLVIYTGDDPSNNGTTIPPPFPTTPPGLGLGRWWQTCQGPSLVAAAGPVGAVLIPNCPTPVSANAPGTPTIVRGRAGNAQIAVSWAPAQSNVPVTSYDVQTFIGLALQSTTHVAPIAPALFPPTTTTISGLVNGTAYNFKARANNGAASSNYSAASAPVTPTAIVAPGIPTNAAAVAGNASALVTWSAPPLNSGGPVTSYTVTVIKNAVVTATTVNVVAPNTSAVVSGLTNGANYAFSVHANNGATAGLESTPSNTVIPTAAANAVTVSVNGPPLPDSQSVPTQITFNITITNTTPGAISAANVVSTLTQLVPDGAFIVLAQPTQGTCTAGGPGVLTTACTLGTLNALATANINVIVKINGNAATLNSAFSGTDAAANPVAAFGTFTLTTPPPGTTTDLQISGSASQGGPNVTPTLPAGAPDAFTFQIKDAQPNTPANLTSLSVVLSGGLKYDGFTSTPAGAVCTGLPVGALGGTLTCSLGTLGGVGNPAQINVVVNTHVIATGNSTAKGTVSFNGTDTNTGNNSVTITVKGK